MPVAAVQTWGSSAFGPKADLFGAPGVVVLENLFKSIDTFLMVLLCHMGLVLSALATEYGGEYDYTDEQLRLAGNNEFLLARPRRNYLIHPRIRDRLTEMFVHMGDTL